LQYILVLFLIVPVFVSASKKERSRNLLVAFWALAAAVISRLGVVETVYYFYCHPRPFLIGGATQLVKTAAICSFPSGHAAFFFALSMVVFLNNWKWGIWFFAGSIFMGLARIFVGIHYPLDIIGGAVSGLAVGWLMHKIFYILQTKNTR
jgi:undecaprenyl-diphosphatase